MATGYKKRLKTLHQELLKPNSPLSRDYLALVQKGAEHRAMFACEIYERYVEKLLNERVENANKEWQEEWREEKREKFEQQLAQRIAETSKPYKPDAISDVKATATIESLTANIAHYQADIDIQDQKLAQLESAWNERQAESSVKLAEKTLGNMTGRAADYILSVNNNRVGTDVEILPTQIKNIEKAFSPEALNELKKPLEEAFTKVAPSAILAKNPELDTQAITGEVMASIGDCLAQLKALCLINQHLQQHQHEHTEEVMPKPSDLRSVKKRVEEVKHSPQDVEEAGQAITATQERKRLLDLKEKAQVSLTALKPADEEVTAARNFKK